MRSAIRFLDSSGKPLDALPDADLSISSAGLDWPGITVESGRNGEWAVDDLAPDRHYLGLNIAAEPLRWEAKIDGRFRVVESAPGGAWFCPAGDRFSHRVKQSSEFVLVTLDAAQFSRWTGDRCYGMGLRYGLHSLQLDHLGGAFRAGVQGRYATVAASVRAWAARVRPSAPGGLLRRLQAISDFPTNRISPRHSAGPTA